MSKASTTTKFDEPEPGDEIEGQWPPERLAKMDEEFRARLQRAIAQGDERPPEPMRRAR